MCVMRLQSKDKARQGKARQDKESRRAMNYTVAIIVSILNQIICLGGSVPMEMCRSFERMKQIDGRIFPVDICALQHKLEDDGYFDDARELNNVVEPTIVFIDNDNINEGDVVGVARIVMHEYTSAKQKAQGIELREVIRW